MNPAGEGSPDTVGSLGVSPLSPGAVSLLGPSPLSPGAVGSLGRHSVAGVPRDGGLTCGATERTRVIRRSVLFSPGDRPELVRKGAASGADTLVADLEDAVAPGAKEEARTATADLLADPGFDPDVELCVRVTGTETAADAAALADAGARVDAVMVPKAERPTTVRETATVFADHGYDVPVLALIETARGVVNAVRVADAEPTDALLFGAEDLTAELGATRTETGEETAYAQQRVVTAATAAGVDAIDTVYTAFENEAGLREATDRAVHLGYDGKMAIHPAQVAPINEAFTPDPEELAWAERVLDARDATDRGVFEVDGEMIDAPLVARAERVRDRADATGETRE